MPTADQATADQATIDEIIKQKDAAMAILDKKIFDAGVLQNANAAGMDAVIDELQAQSQAVLDQALDAVLASAELAAALAAITAATNAMNTVAARMVKATEFISNLTALGTATNQVVTALKGPG